MDKSINQVVIEDPLRVWRGSKHFRARDRLSTVGLLASNRQHSWCPLFQPLLWSLHVYHPYIYLKACHAHWSCFLHAILQDKEPRKMTWFQGCARSVQGGPGSLLCRKVRKHAQNDGEMLKELKRYEPACKCSLWPSLGQFEHQNK